MADSRGTTCNPSVRHMRTAYKSCNHDQLPELPNFKSRTQRMNVEKNRHMKPAEFASLLCEKLEKLKLDNDDESRKINENQMPAIQDQRLSSPYHHAPGMNMLRPSFYPTDDYFDDSQSWIMPPASDRYSVAGASSHSGSGANMEKNRNIKEKAKELRNAVHHSLRNGLGECECHSCDIKRQEKTFQSTYTKDSSKHSSEYCRRSLVPGNPGCCCHGKDNYCSNQTYPLYRKYNSEESSHRTADYPHENVNEDFVPPMDNTKIYAWMELNDRLKHEPTYPDHTPSPAVRRKKQPKDYERNTGAQTVQPIAQDLGMPLLPQPDTGNVLEEVKRVLEEPEQRVPPIKKMPTRTHPPPIQQQPYHFDQHAAYSDTSYENTGSLTTTNWSLSDTHSRSSHNPSQISTVPSSASRLWNREGYYDSSSDVRLENKSGASKSHSTGTGTGRHSSQPHTSRSDHRSSNTRAENHNNDMRSQRTGRSHGSHGSHGSDGNKTHTTTVTYYFGVEPIPYRITVPSYEVTLGQFKKSSNKKGNFRFFFKTISQDDGEVVYEEVRDENEKLPRFKDKIIGKVEKIE